MSGVWFDNASCQQSPYKMMNDQHHSHQNQGIVSILSSDFNNSSSFSFSFSSNNININNSTIRRTLSAADMSSQKCPHSSLKRVQSSLQLQDIHHNIDDDDHNTNNNAGQAFEEIWSSIEADKKSWGSILSPANTDGSGSGSDSAQLPPPYVHPLAKRWASSLSEKSLEICTESLGSETGSDVFSYPPEEPEDSDKEHEQEEEQQQEQQQQQQEIEVKGYNNNTEVGNNSSRGPTLKRSMMVPPVRPSFPPPLPSLGHRDDGSNLHIRAHRQDGRLVVEAVTVLSLNCFRAQRQDGRLLLTLSSDDTHEQEHNQYDEMFNNTSKNDETAIQEEEEEEDDDDDEEEEEVLAVPRGVINVQRSFTMSKLLELTNTRNKSTWPRKYNKTVIKTLDDNEEEIEDEKVELTVTQSLPPQPRVSTATAAAVALNAYEYYWRRSNSPAAAAAVAMLNPLVGQQKNTNKINKIYCAPGPQVERDTKKNNNKLLYAAHNKKGVALPQSQEVVLVKAAVRRGGGKERRRGGEKPEYLVPLMLRGCKEPKRSLLSWDPPCIATS